MNVKPDHSLGAFFIGVTGPMTTVLTPDRPTWLIPENVSGRPRLGSRSRKAGVRVRRQDRQDRRPVDRGLRPDRSELARTANRSIEVVVERAVIAGGRPTGQVQRIAATVGPQRMRELGLVMKMGPVVAVQDSSPADRAGIQAGDWIVDPGGDPMTLSDRLARRAGQVVEITLFRDWMGLPLPVAVPVRLREPTEMPVEGLDGPLGVSPLGCACRVLNQIDRVVAGSPAAKAGIQAGDLLTEARLVPPLRDVLENLQI